jgi:alpha-beta hydrolase superfamily lysophospholipase
VKWSWLLAGALVLLNGPALRAQDYPLSIPPAADAPKAKYEKLEVTARDDAKLVVHEWAPAKVVAGKPVILFLHGIGMHGKPYEAVQAGFTSRDLVFVVPDLRGHGSSDGKRGELAEPHVLRADIGAEIALIYNRYPDSPVVLVGDSMGGLLAADYAWRGERRLAGLVLLVPGFKVHPSQVKLSDLANALGPIPLAKEERLSPSTRDKGFIKARLADKLALPEVKTSYLLTISKMERDWPEAAAGIKLPLFVGVAGKDKIVDTERTKAVFDAAATPKADKTWRRWDDAYHTVCWDPQTPKIVEEVAQWALKLPKDETKKTKD